ncbi:MAG: hypothetical protein GTO22_01600 [Gemmatimonadales bacterium]|nr:hypothetical protein [Gemmatimonadales bacterium]
MRFIEINEIAEWCREHRIPITEAWRLEDDLTLRHVSRALHSPKGRSGKEGVVARSCAQTLTPWSECLLWVTEWGVWGSTEDWPQYYAVRGRLGEKRSLEKAPGHLFESEEGELLEEFLTQVLQNGWDAHLLPADAFTAGRRIYCSHDGWTELRARESGQELAAV